MFSDFLSACFPVCRTKHNNDYTLDGSSVADSHGYEAMWGYCPEESSDSLPDLSKVAESTPIENDDATTPGSNGGVIAEEVTPKSDGGAMVAAEVQVETLLHPKRDGSAPQTDKSQLLRIVTCAIS